MFIALRCSRFLRYLALIILFSTANVPAKKDAVPGKDAKEKVRRYTQKMTFSQLSLSAVCRVVYYHLLLFPNNYRDRAFALRLINVFNCLVACFLQEYLARLEAIRRQNFQERKELQRRMAGVRAPVEVPPAQVLKDSS